MPMSENKTCRKTLIEFVCSFVMHGIISKTITQREQLLYWKCTHNNLRTIQCHVDCVLHKSLYACSTDIA